MREHKLQLKYQGGEKFIDDWESADEDGTLCWWSICKSKLPQYIQLSLTLLKGGGATNVFLHDI